MKEASAELIAFLNSSQTFLRADLYTITLNDGNIVRYTSCDVDITVSNNTFLANGPLFERSNTSVKTGVEVGTLDVTITPDPDMTVSGVPWLQAGINGVFDGAVVTVDELITDNFSNTSRGTICMFGNGRVADVEVNRADMIIHVKSALEILNVMWPIEIFQPSCLNNLYDNNCKVNAANFTTVSAVGANSTRSSILCNLTANDGYYDQGKIQFTSGDLVGRQFGIRVYETGVVTPVIPLPVTPTPGWTFNALPGCDLLKDGDCTTTFNNVVNFRATPFVPVPETSV